MQFHRSPSLVAVLTVVLALAALAADIGTYWP